MGYFSNGTEGRIYEETYCDHCVNQGAFDESGCWIWRQHLMNNYEDCNKPNSILHKLIPQDAQTNNLECVMFRRTADDVRNF
jgi:hypothetical protein